MGRAQWETWRQMGGNRRKRVKDVKGKGDEQDMFFSINLPQNCVFQILALRRSLDQEVFIQALAKDFNMSVAYAARAGSLVQSNWHRYIESRIL